MDLRRYVLKFSQDNAFAMTRFRNYLFISNKLYRKVVLE